MEKMIRQGGVEAKFLKYVDKLNRRAVKIGCTPLSVVKVRDEMVRDEVVWEESRHTVEHFDPYSVYEINGETPVINGWDFIARLEHDSVLGTVVRTAPGKTLPKRFWDAAGNCEHCNTKRVRKDTFILREVATGEYKQIGRQCVRDFIGYENPADMYWWVAIMDEVSNEIDELNEGGRGVREHPYMSVERVLTFTLAAIDAWGYVSRKMSEEKEISSTTSDVSCLFFSFKLENAQKSVISAANSGKYDEQVAKIIAWVKGWDAKTKQQSEFNFNVSRMVDANFVRSNMFGFITCLPTMYLKAMDLLKEKAAKSNEFLGTVGEKLSVGVRITNIIHIQGSFGMASLVMMEDKAGNSVKWFSSANPQVRVGDEVVVRGTVKSHDNYKGTNQTMLTRCKFI